MVGTDIDLAATLLKAGKLVAVPTETVYGLAANALNEEAVFRIFEVKRRPAFDPLIVHVRSSEEMERFADIEGDLVKKLVSAFCPGPVTFVLPKKPVIPDVVTSGLNTVGMRIPDHPLTLELLGKLDFPLAAPSANLFGYTSPGKAEHVEKQLGSKIDYILDGGACKVGLESTILKIEGDNIRVLRLGGLSLEEIEEAAGRRVSAVETSSSNPAAPGMLDHHYNPGLPVYFGDVETLIGEFKKRKIGLLTFKPGRYKGIKVHEVLSEIGDIDEAARNLFSALRKLAEEDIDLIIAEKLPEKGLGRAVNDRLTRASVRR